jgi:hypothetical protein
MLSDGETVPSTTKKKKAWTAANPVRIQQAGNSSEIAGWQDITMAWMFVGYSKECWFLKSDSWFCMCHASFEVPDRQILQDKLPRRSTSLVKYTKLSAINLTIDFSLKGNKDSSKHT